MTDAENTPADAPPADDAGLRAELEKAQRQVADYRALVADFDNARKRLTQSAERERKYAHEPLARDLLGVLDNLEAAVAEAAKGGDAGPLAKGVSATVSLMLDVLKRYGVTRIEVGPGTPFDPNRHEALAEVPSADVPPGAVAQVYKPGYLLHDRLLRAAGVVVAAGG
jgi:molecular chaperone GrpE